MPAPSQTFQGIAANSQEGPFSQYLKPVIPQPIDNPLPQASGYESAPIGVGQVAMNFLQGVRQKRIADFLQKERNNEFQLENLRNYANAKIQSGDLTDEGQSAVMNAFMDTLNRHGQYETKDIKKEHGVAHFVKSALVNMAGGPVPTREPVNWDEARGQISTAAEQHSQSSNFGRLTAQGQQVISDLMKKNPNPSQEEVGQALQKTYFDMLRQAPKYAGLYRETMSSNFPSVNSLAYAMKDLELDAAKEAQYASAQGQGGQLGPLAPATAPPPSPYGPDMATYGLQAQPQAAAPAAATPGPGPRAAVAPGEAAAPSPYGPDRATYGLTPYSNYGQSPAAVDAMTTAPSSALDYGPRRFAKLSYIAGIPHSALQISQPVLVSSGGKRQMAVMMTGSTNPRDNGYWDANTLTKIPGTVTKQSVEGQQFRVGQDLIVREWNNETGRWEATRNEKGEPMTQSFALTPYMDPYTQLDRLGNRAQASGQISGQQGIELQNRVAKLKQNLNDERYKVNDWYTKRTNEIQQNFDNFSNNVRKNLLEGAYANASAFGLKMSKAEIADAMKTPEELIQTADKSRQAAMNQANTQFQQRVADIQKGPEADYNNAQKVLDDLRQSAPGAASTAAPPPGYTPPAAPAAPTAPPPRAAPRAGGAPNLVALPPGADSIYSGH